MIEILSDKNVVNNCDVFIIGGGISGLSLGFYLKNLGIEFHLIEKSKRLGGVIQSQQIGSYSLDLGPQTFLLEPEIKKLLKELGLIDKVLLPDTASSNRYLGIPGKNPKIRLFPKKLRSVLFSRFFSINEIIKIIKEIFGNAPKGNKDDLSIYHLFEQRLGKNLTNRVISAPFVGVWANSIKNLSARSVLPQAYKAYIKGESVLKNLLLDGLKKQRQSIKIATLQGGLESLTKALSNVCARSIGTSEEIISIIYKNGTWDICTNFAKYSAKKLVISSGANDLIEILEKIESREAENTELIKLKKLVNSIKTSPLGIIQFSVARGSINAPLDGFGVLIPPQLSLGFLGAIYSSSIFPHKSPGGRDLITCFCGGAIRPEFSNVLDKDISEALIGQFRQFFKITSPITKISSSYWPKGIPEYSVFHYQLEDALKIVEGKFPGLYFNSNLLGGVSIPSRVRCSLGLACKIASQ